MMDFALWPGASRSHSRGYGEDEQQRHGAKGTFSFSGICEADHLQSWHGWLKQ